MKEVVQLFAAALAPIIAIFGGYIAWRQHRLQRQRLRLDLYEKRFEVYRAVKTLLHSVISEGRVNVEEILRFRTDIAEAAFFYGDDVNQYLEQLTRNVIQFRRKNERLRANTLPDGEARSDLVDAESALLGWLTDQHTAAPDVFSPYLAFRDL